MGSLLNHAHGTIVDIIRRPGWPLCRAEARELSDLVPQLRNEGRSVSLIGIVHETHINDGADVYELAKEYFPNGTLYLDKSRQSFYAINPDAKTGKGSWMKLTELFSLASIRAGLAASKNNVKGNLKGEGRLYGGMFVSGPDKEILYFQKEVLGVYADRQKVLSALRSISMPGLQPSSGSISDSSISPEPASESSNSGSAPAVCTRQGACS